MSGGLVVMALTAAAVVSNAVFLQKAQHPEPWFMTRPSPVATAPEIPATVPDPRPRAIALVETVKATPEAVAPAPGPTPARAPEAKLVSDLQQALSERGLYQGKVDGISGSRTRAAITAYEKSQGLPVTGAPSAGVLDHINTASVAPPAPPAKPVPAAAQPVAAEAAEPAIAPARPAPVETVAAAPIDQAPPATKVALAPEPEQKATPAASPSDRYLTVQRALNLIGYGPVAEDGMAGDAIENAIRRFELDNGLPITGAPGDTVVNRLVAIGAMNAT
jgi:peptidoglycan hydrolase-like protein with peptidoglycan-binding domain